MKDFDFSIPTHIHFGANAQEDVGRMTAKYGKHVLILYGSQRIQKNGLLPDTIARLEAEGIQCETFGGISENPLLSAAEAACQVVREKNIDVLLAIGGGSVIDTAKAVSIGSCSEHPLWDYYSGKAVPQQALPIGVILTMAATASEANGVSVLTNEQLGKKTAFTNPLTYPKFALLNPKLTYTVPAEQTAVGAIDIFAHAFERYFHLGQRGTLRTYLCTAVMKTVQEELPKAQRNPQDYESRSQLMWAATVAHSDMIGTEGVFACHAMSHILTKTFDLPHGMALGILMPAWCKYMLMRHADEIAGFASQIWDVEDADRPVLLAAQEGISKFQHFICDAGLPVTLREAGIVHCDSRDLAEQLVTEEGYLGENFEKLYREDIQAIFELARG